MDDGHRMTRKERLVRLAGGIGVIVLGCVVFSVSKTHDPANRAAVLSIVAIFFGLTWIGQAIRGHRELVPHHVEPVTGPAVPPHTTVLGLVLGLLVPGLGHWLIGRRQKAILFFTVITATFLLGVLLAHGRNLSYERDKVYFLAYVWNLGETAIGWLLTRHLEYDAPVPHLYVGFLYSAVASLLNLVVVIDFFNTSMRSAQPAVVDAGDVVEPVDKAS